MNYKTVKQIASEWCVKEQEITYFCRKGKIENCVKKEKTWLIPEDAEKPKTLRKERAKKLPLPIGLSNYKEMSQKYYYVDKTLMIKDIIDSLPKVALFTRPRRFGKTLNMDMLKVFFEKNEEETSIYFKDKLIWKCGEEYRSQQGQYPVIYLSFKDVKFSSWQDSLEKFKDLLAYEYLRHSNLKNEISNDIELGFFNKIIHKEANEVEMTTALYILSKLLYEQYHKPAVIIIDEYDTPIEQAYLEGYYDKTISFMRNLFSGAFKDNNYLAFGFLTGILRVAKESIFSGLNNLKEYSILNNKFSEYFGFTESEVKTLLSYYGYQNKMDEVIEWYDGYKFGEQSIFNPWSVLNYIAEGGHFGSYWSFTGSNGIIKQLTSKASAPIKAKLEALISGHSISISLDTSVIYPELRNNQYAIFNFLLMAGYLKVVNNISNISSHPLYEVKIPNKEVGIIYSEEILSAFSQTSLPSSAALIQESIINNNTIQLKKAITDFLKESISVFDTGSESFYQGLMLGIYAALNNMYTVVSNREAGDGRFDIELSPIDSSHNKTGIIIEIKVLSQPKSPIETALKSLAKLALKQINDKNYVEDLKQKGIENILKYGFAFYRKQAEIICEEEICK